MKKTVPLSYFFNFLLLSFGVMISFLKIQAQGNTGGLSDSKFYHGFKHLEESGADQYLHDQVTIKKYSEWQSPPLTYFGPSANDEFSTLTYKYSFDGAIQSAKARISLSVWNFNVSGANGSGSGEASAWASKDGSNWVNLIDLPEPTTSFSDGKTFEDMLPSSVLGDSTIYLQIRMKVSGAPNSSYTTAQFGRSDASANKDIFYLDANYSTNIQATEIISFDNIENPEQAFELTGGASLKFGDPLVDQTSSFRIQANKNDPWQGKSIATFKQSFDLSDFEMNFNMHFYDSYSAGGGDFLWVSLVNPTDEDISVHIAFYSWYTGQSSNAARVILRKSTNGTFEEVWANDVKSLLGINTFSKVGLSHSPYAVNILYNSGVLSLKINDLSVFTQEIDLNDLGVLDSEGKAKIAFRGHTGAAREFHDVSNWKLTLNKPNIGPSNFNPIPPRPGEVPGGFVNYISLLGEIKGEVLKAEKELSDLMKEGEEKEQKIGELEVELSRLNQEFARVEGELRSCEEQGDRTRDQIKEVEKTILSRELEIIGLQGQVDDVQARLDAAHCEHLKVEERLEFLKEEMTGYADKLKTAHTPGWHYVPGYGWLWTSPKHYPQVYSNTRNGWLYYEPGTSEPWLYYDYNLEQWEEWFVDPALFSLNN